MGTQHFSSCSCTAPSNCSACALVGSAAEAPAGVCEATSGPHTGGAAGENRQSLQASCLFEEVQVVLLCVRTSAVTLNGYKLPSLLQHGRSTSVRKGTTWWCESPFGGGAHQPRSTPNMTTRPLQLSGLLCKLSECRGCRRLLCTLVGPVRASTLCRSRQRLVQQRHAQAFTPTPLVLATSADYTKCIRNICSGDSVRRSVCP